MELLIKTDRLLISQITKLDLEDARILHNDPEVLRWLSDTRQVSEYQQEVWFTNLEQSKTSRRFVVRTLLDSTFIGVFRFDNYDHENKSVNVGLDIAPLFRRSGFARETYQALIPYFFNNLQLNRLALVTLATNVAAIKLYEELGFKREGVLREAFYRDAQYIDAYTYSLLATEVKY
jgi:RimJ/RimL family protein N-acetyltransferase